jgi:hypothetical protein
MAGLDVGISGAVLCLAWLSFHSWLRGEFWWAKFNVAAAVFFGDSVYAIGLGRATLSGIALLIAVYALLGVVFSLLARTQGFTRNLLLGFMAALLWHSLADRYFWRMLDVFAPAYFPSLATLPAHLLLAINFSRFAARYRALALAFGSPDWAGQFIEVSSPEPEPSAAPEPAEGAESSESTDTLSQAPPATPVLPPPTLATLLLPAPQEPPAPPATEAPSEKSSEKGSPPPIVE